MSQTTLILIALMVLLIALGVWILRATKRSRRAMAPLAGLLLLFGGFYPPDPPPPPPAESAKRRADDEGSDDPEE